MLEIDRIDVSYGRLQVLFGLELRIPAGQVVALMGRNGMGKTTALRAIMGLVPVGTGTIRLRGADITNRPSHRIARAGIGLVPEGRRIFPNLSTRENLLAAAANRRHAAAPWTLERVFDLFPRLAERADLSGTQLSGGEQQMLAIGRALMTNPDLLILDEATEGLAPLARQAIWSCLARLKAEGLALLVVERDIKALATLAESCVMIEKGRVAWTGSGIDLAADPALVQKYLGI